MPANGQSLAASVHGRDAVVIVSAESCDRERLQHDGPRPVEALALSPLGELDLERPIVEGPLRTIDL